MDFITLLVVLFPVSFAWFYFLRSNSSHRRWKAAKLPPGPYPFPIIGNILQIGKSPQKSLAKLSKTYGPIMSLQLGSIYTVVVSSPEMAREILQKHDLVFSSRTIVAAAQAHDHDKISMAFLPVGTQWRKFRKICREHMFSNLCLEASHGLRQETLKKLCDYVENCSISNRAVNINEAAFVTSLNLISATLFSADLAYFDSYETQELKHSIGGVGEILGRPNFADFFPVLKTFDLQGIKREAEFYFGKSLGLIEDVINQRLEERRTSNGSPKKNDMLETLLDLSEGSEYDLSYYEIKHLLVDLFVAGSDSIATSIEWIITELLLNPEKMSKAKQEIITVIGPNAKVQESDISKLSYLQAVVKENFRLHPPGPLLVPHKSEKDVEISGYTIPKHTQVLINVWAIGRDSSVWSNPTCFEPERFLGSKMDFKGQDFELIPFGSGRRMCPGIPLASRIIYLTVATLIYEFDWKFEEGIRQEDSDIEETCGLALRKTVPLKAIPIKA